ncbi:hypothetical protein [Candidatus Mesenet endosymbiont of Phosphuga atrata]|uniref:hypothetical protein n=1 Tax=Candidatus Mesenet endosymbiont of Phosphuga atrata TaxID=3066221 RepID=UPI0030CD4413
MTEINLKPANFINDNIDSEIKKIVKEANNREQDLENIKNLLQEPQYKESYPNIRPFFENQKGFDALKDVLLFEKNRVLGKTTQENINVVSSMKVLKNIFVSNNNQASEIQKNTNDVDQSIQLIKKQSEELKEKFKERLKKESKASPVIRLLRFLFKKVINKIFEEIKNEQLGKPKEELDSLKGQFHKIIDSFNNELNSLMGAYGKGIESSSTAYITPDPDYATIEKIFPKQEQQNAQQKLSQSYDESDYVSAEKVRQLKRQQKSSAEGLKVEYQVVHNAPQHLQIHDLPKPQRAQISEKPKIATKPSKEVIERALSNAANQKKVAPPVPPRGESSFKKVEELRNKLDVRRDGLQPAGSVKGIAQMFEAKAQEEKKPVQNIIKQMRIKEEVKSAGLGSTQELAKEFDTKEPKKLIIPEEFKRKLEKITTPSPSPSPMSSKKPFAMFKNSDVKNKASKAQETKQSIFYGTVSSDVPTPPPMPTEDDLKKVKLTSGKERDITSQVNPKKDTATESKTTEEKNTSFDQVLKELYNLKEKKASIEENKPQTKLTNPNIEHAKNTPAIGG